jgi:tRNA(fMet)-specific endonuclease VapC
LSVLLDTNACIAVINNKPQARTRLRQVHRRREIAFVSTISLFELWFGIGKSRRAAENTQQLDAFLSLVQPLAFDEDDARAAGELRLALARAGTPIGSYDLLIAAQGLRRGLTIVTANVSEFSPVPNLRWQNWEA